LVFRNRSDKSFVQFAYGADEDLPALARVDVDALAGELFPQSIEGIQVDPVDLERGLDLVLFFFFAYTGHLHSLDIILGHIVSRAALIAYPLAVGVHADRVEPAQDSAAFSADAHDRPEAIAAEDIFCTVFGMFPFMDVFRLLAEIARFHFIPFIPFCSGLLKFFYYSILGH
jgi:hypothetical protein